MAKRVAVADIDIANLLNNYFNEDVEIVQTDLTRLDGDYDLVCIQDDELDISSADLYNVINVHYSLLPAFAQKDAMKTAFTSGVKVGGITIHKVEKDNFYGKILAQFPVLIGNTTHFDEYKSELEALRDKLLPAVVDSILNDRVFDFEDMMKPSCHGGCGGCNGCSH